MSESIETIKERIAGDYKHLSSVSILRHMQDVVAIAVKLMSDLIYDHKVQINRIIESSAIPTKAWYKDQFLKFQYGHELQLINYRPSYLLTDEVSKIIRYADITEKLGGIIAKLAKEDRTELFTVAEINAINAYASKIKYPGTIVSIVNQLADTIVMSVDVKVDREIIDLTGLRLGTDNLYPIKDAIIEYINSADFGGLLEVNKIEDSIQSIEGVIYVKLNQIEATTATLKETVIFSLNDGINLMSYQSEAGHISIIDDDLTINYL